MNFPNNPSHGPRGQALRRAAPGRPRLSIWIGAVCLAAVALAGPGRASAQTIDNPPLLPQDITVFPDRDFTSIAGFAANADLLVQVRRNGVVGDAVGRTDGAGVLEINHPGGVCWRNVTPDIGPGDTVRATYRDTSNNRVLVPALIGSGAATNSQNISALHAVDAGNGTVVIRGTALLPNGNRIPLNRLEVRIVNPGFIDPPASRIGKRDIRADSLGGRIDGGDGNPIPGAELQVVVRRGTSNRPVIGTARGIVPNGGIFEVNHPGGVCWSGQTPDLRAGDIVDVFQVVNLAFSSGQQQEVIDTRVTRAAFVTSSGELRVNGVASDETGAPFPLGRMEQRIINPDFNTTRIGRRDIRADTAGGRVQNVPGGAGNLSRVGGSTSSEWRAVYTGLNDVEKQLAVAGQSRAMAWLATNGNGDRFGLTISEAGEIGGPGMGNCPAPGNASIAIP